MGVTLPVEKDPLEGINIQAEYDLIFQKKSTLSANQRDAVEYRMAKITEKIRQQAQADKIPEENLIAYIAEKIEETIKNGKKSEICN